MDYKSDEPGLCDPSLYHALRKVAAPLSVNNVLQQSL
jgi:hypothetical protein